MLLRCRCYRICSLNYPTEKLILDFYRLWFFNLNFAVISLFNFQSSRASRRKLVGTSGLEPPTSRLSGVRSNHLSYAPMYDIFRYLARLAVLPYPRPYGGDEEDRTPDTLRARQVLSQLSYTPMFRDSDMPLLPLLKAWAFKIEQHFSFTFNSSLTESYERLLSSRCSIERR